MISEFQLINHIGIIKSIDDLTHSAVVVFYAWATYLDKRKKIVSLYKISIKTRNEHFRISIITFFF